MNEKLIERKLRDGVKKMGGLALKIWSASFTGLPDRMILMPMGRVWFAELKSTGKKASARQRTVHGILSKLGFGVFVIDDQQGLDEFFKTITA